MRVRFDGDGHYGRVEALTQSEGCGYLRASVQKVGVSGLFRRVSRDVWVRAASLHSCSQVGQNSPCSHLSTAGSRAPQVEEQGVSYAKLISLP